MLAAGSLQLSMHIQATSLCRCSHSCAEMSLVWMQAGFTDVTHLEGGLNQWRYDGYPVMRNNRVYRQEPKRFAKSGASKKRTQM